MSNALPAVLEARISKIEDTMRALARPVHTASAATQTVDITFTVGLPPLDGAVHRDT